MMVKYITATATVVVTDDGIPAQQRLTSSNFMIQPQEHHQRQQQRLTQMLYSKFEKRFFINPLLDFTWGYTQNYYNPFDYGGPIDGGDNFDGPYGGFAPNPFAKRPVTSVPSLQNDSPGFWGKGPGFN